MVLALKLNAEWAAIKKASIITTQDLIRSDDITAEEIEGLVDLYPEWETTTSNMVDGLVRYNIILYQVI